MAKKIDKLDRKLSEKEWIIENIDFRWGVYK